MMLDLHVLEGMPGTRPDAKSAKPLLSCRMTVMKDNQDERADLGKHESPIDAVNPLTDLQLFTRILLDSGVQLPSGEKE
jgi:hypothetical protein